MDTQILDGYSLDPSISYPKYVQDVLVKELIYELVIDKSTALTGNINWSYFLVKKSCLCLLFIYKIQTIFVAARFS